MATIIQKPDTLSLSRNLKELIISTSSEISLQLLKGDSMLLEETYLPDVNNRVHVDLADIVTSTLSLTMPSGDAVSTSQSSVYSDFTVKVDGTSVAEFTAVRSGVERFSDTAANFLTANWLTWQPQVKEVLHDQPEWLTYYPASGSCACYARFYYTDGTSGEKKVCDVSQCVSINTRFSKLWALDESGKERYGVIDVYIKDAQGLRLTYVQRYVLCSQGALDEVYLCENSLGGLDTFRFYGDRKLVPEIGYTSLLLDNSYTAADPDLSRKWSQNTGMLTGRECEWCWELFRSSAAYHLYRGTILPIVLDASSVEKSAMSVLAAYSFDYRYASDLGLLNVVRSENLPEVVEISGPDAEVFFLTPRLNEFPSAVLSDDLIIPVQSPYEESWYTLSVGGLKSALLSSVETIYGPMWHVHDNLQVLNLLSADEKGNLLYNGLAVGSGIVGAHDHHGETIRPSVLVIPTTAPSVDSDLRPGEYAMYLDSSSAVDGETPTKAGLDEEELWAILSGNAGTEVVAKQHLPSDTVYSEDLDDYIKMSDLNTLDFVTLSTDQIITGKKTFANDVIFGAAKEDGSYSRLLIPSTSGPGIYDLYVSTEPVDGEVPSASGGIDEDELWTILGGSSTNKVIDPSHIPVIPVEKVSGLGTALSSYATKEWVEGKGYLTSVSLSTISDLHASWDSLLQSAPDFYSKGSVYSKSEADGRFVGIANEQTVTGRKTFSALLTASAGISGTNADLSGYLSATKLYLPYSGGNKVYDICISTQPIDGEAPSVGGGINEEELWSILGGSGTQKIGASHIPPLSELSGNLDSSRITGLDSALTSYAKKDGSNATGTWPISISGNAASATRASYITPRQFGNQGTIGALKSSIVSAMDDGKNLKYPGQSYITSGSHVSTIMSNWSNDGFSIPAGSQMSLLRLDNYQSSTYGVFLVSGYSGGFYRLLRNDSSTWKGPFILLDSENYHNIADSRYVKKAGDTMTGKLTVDVTSTGNALDLVSENATETYLRVYMGASYKAAIGYHTTHGTYLYNRLTYTYLGLRDNGLAYRDGNVMWDSGNDGSGSGLDADLLDGYQASSFLLKSGGTMTGNLTLKSMGGTWLNGKTQAPIMTNGDSSINGSTYHPIIWGRTAAGDVWNLGHGANDQVGFYGFYSERTANGTDWEVSIKVSSGLFYASHGIYTGGKLYIPSSQGNQVFDAYIA